MEKLYLKNFKAFKEEFNLEIKNKNLLLYGENGAGKSSLFEALKIIFFKDKIETLIDTASTPEDQVQINNDFWSNFNNKIDNSDFIIKVNEDTLTRSDYQVFMVSFSEIKTYEKIELKIILSDFYFDINDLDIFCDSNYSNIQDEVNSILIEFKEVIQIEIDKEDNYSIKITDNNKNISSKVEIHNYFNEAKINLINLLLLFVSIKLSQNSDKKRIIILDDFITSLDASNRTFLMKYIFNSFSEFQILLFTHNVSFYNLIMYLIKDIYKDYDKWGFGNLYEINNESKIYIKSSIERVDDLETYYSENPQNILEIGNKIRQKFEILLYEFSKIIMIGAVEESDAIINKIEKNENIYYRKNGNKTETASNLLDEIIDVLNEGNDNNLSQRINTKIDNYKINSLENFKKIISDLKLYRKVTMHPMSHGNLGLTAFTTNEIEKSLELLGELEKNIKRLVDNNVVNV